jgi:hypothetical protein
MNRAPSVGYESRTDDCGGREEDIDSTLMTPPFPSAYSLPRGGQQRLLLGGAFTYPL